MADQSTNPTPPSNKAIKDQVALLSFVEDIIEERKDPNIKPENLPKVKELLLKEVNDSINRHLISLLPDKEQVELDELLDKNVSDEEIDAYFAKKIPNLEAEIASVLLNFRAAYLYPLKAQEAQTQEQSQSPPPDPMVAKPSFPPPAPVPVDKIN